MQIDGMQMSIGFNLGRKSRRKKYICEPKLRFASMKYAVGMIVSIKSKEQLAGVIIGWQHSEFESWKELKSRNDPRLKDPILEFYSVLCEDEKLYHESEGM